MKELVAWISQASFSNITEKVSTECETHLYVHMGVSEPKLIRWKSSESESCLELLAGISLVGAENYRTTPGQIEPHLSESNLDVLGTRFHFVVRLSPLPR